MDALLLSVLLARKRLGTFPCLSLFIAVDLLSGLVLFYVDSAAHSRVYANIYLIFDVLSFLVQLLMLFEIARNVLRISGGWKRAAVRLFIFISAGGALVAYLATFLIEPAGLTTGQSLQLRAEMFTGLMTCETVIAMMWSAKEMGLPWRSHVMAIGQGLMFWVLIAVTAVAAGAYLGPHNPYYTALYYLRGIAYLVTVAYWTVSLWRKEPERLPISPALRKYVVALHERVQYDLGKAGH